MHTLRVLINDKELLSTESPLVSWLSWDLVASTREPHYAGLSVSGSIEVAEGEYDMLDWLNWHPLEAGDTIDVQILPMQGHTPFVQRRTPAEQEALRQDCIAAEASGELNAMRIVQRPQYRSKCSLRLDAPTHESVMVTSVDSIEAVTCSGIWSSVHKQDQWRLRVTTIPTKGVPGTSSTVFWCPINGITRIQLGA